MKSPSPERRDRDPGPSRMEGHKRPCLILPGSLACLPIMLRCHLVAGAGLPSSGLPIRTLGKGLMLGQEGGSNLSKDVDQVLSCATHIHTHSWSLSAWPPVWLGSSRTLLK